MKKIIACLSLLALTIALSMGVTLSYLTENDKNTNVMTLGNVRIDQLEYERIDAETADEDAKVQSFHDNRPLLPGVYYDDFDFGVDGSQVDWTQIGKDGYTSGIWNPEKVKNELDKMVFVKNKGGYDTYVRTVFAFEAGQYKTLAEFLKMAHLNRNEINWTWEWVNDPVTIGESTYFVAVATYHDILKPGTVTEISLSQMILDQAVTNEDVDAFGKTYQILVKSQAIQTGGFDDAAAALDEGFGVIDAGNVPWDNDAPTRGVDIRTALHYLNGNTANPITQNVVSVTYGRHVDYPNVADYYEETPVDLEQDVTAYAYYVNNGSNYDVYLLSDDVIYAPADSSKLYSGMSALASLNTDNLDTSRVTNMTDMLHGCVSLTGLDVSGWDTSNVTTFDGMFYGCTSLCTIYVGDGWTMRTVTGSAEMFGNCTSLVGGNGTAYDSAHTDATYARIDTAETPGYLTYKPVINP